MLDDIIAHDIAQGISIPIPATQDRLLPPWTRIASCLRPHPPGLALLIAEQTLRDLPERFGDPIKIHTRFSRWAKSGAWKKIFEMLAADVDNEYAMIDSTIVRAHQHSAGAQKKTAKTRRSGAAKAD